MNGIGGSIFRSLARSRERVRECVQKMECGVLYSSDPTKKKKERNATESLCYLKDVLCYAHRHSPDKGGLIQ